VDQPNVVTRPREPWNKGKLVGQKAPFKLKEIWAIRIRLQLANCARDLALFDLASDSKLRACYSLWIGCYGKQNIRLIVRILRGYSKHRVNDAIETLHGLIITQE